MNRIALIGILTIILISLIATTDSLQPPAAGQTISATRDEAIQRLQNSLAGRGSVKRSRATGLVDFVRLDRTTLGTLI